MQITIDPRSGFCFGVTYAIEIAERELKEHKRLYCLGEIVHNHREVNRLREMGLIIIQREDLPSLKHCSVLIRAHGEPPETYRIAAGNNIRLIDATCPIVMNLQQDVKTAYSEMQEKEGQVVIYGNEGHPEVEGLIGQADGQAIVVGNEDDLVMIDKARPVRLFAQTTKSVEGFTHISGLIREQMIVENPLQKPDFIASDSVCRQVSGRSVQLNEFASEFDVVIFVSGNNSSNGNVLYNVCKEANPRTYKVSDPSDLQRQWFEGINKTGICGATSTPVWLMEEIRQAIINLVH
jgi:4-hydroxy-3-methylbut-2-en-1-yl diphosphate reductase